MLVFITSQCKFFSIHGSYFHPKLTDLEALMTVSEVFTSSVQFSSGESLTHDEGGPGYPQPGFYILSCMPIKFGQTIFSYD